MFDAGSDLSHRTALICFSGLLDDTNCFMDNGDTVLGCATWILGREVDVFLSNVVFLSRCP